MNDTTRPARHSKGWLWGALLVAPLLFNSCVPAPTQPAAANPNAICFQPTARFPASGPPTIDGNPAELNWTGAFRYVAESGVGAPHVIVQGLKDSSFLYLSFEVNADPYYNDKDAILLGFSPGGGAGNDRRIFVFPVCDGVGTCNNNGNPGPPRTVVYWNNSTTWSAAGGVTDPPWLTNTGNISLSNIRVGTPGPGSWQVEMRIPINSAAADTANPGNDSGINLPASGTFGFWFDVIRVSSAPGTPPNAQTANELAWPSAAGYGSNLTNIITLTTNMPAPNTWGTGRRDQTTACNGVTLEWSDIKVEHPNTVSAVGADIISLNQANVFTVTPWNDSVDTNGNYIQGSGLMATFKIKNFGLPGPSWQPVGVFRANTPANNPTAPVDIPAATPTTFGTVKISTGAWNLNGDEQGDYGAHTGQCMLVDLDAPNTNTVIKSKSTTSNMTFMTTSSPFRVKPTVDMRNYRVPEGQDQLEFLLSTFAYHTDPEQRWSTVIEGLKEIGKGQYLLKGTLGSQVDLATTLTPPSIEIPSVDVKVAPGTGGRDRKAEAVRVRPGDVLTLISHGAIRVRPEGPGKAGVTAGPEGVRLAQSSEGTSRDAAFVLGKEYDPQGRVGALIGSWDNFAKSAFPIGGATTLKVPEKAEALHLALNDTPAGFAQQAGEGFQVQVIATPLEKKYVIPDSRLARDPSREAIRMPLAANLPMWIMCGERKTGKKLAIDKDTFELTENVGCFGYAMRRIGR